MAKRQSVISACLFLAIAGLLPARAGAPDDIKAAYQKQDFAAAMRMLMPLAEAGNPEAQYTVGYMYGHGQSVPQDLPRALAWFKTAADQNYAEAEFSIGLMFDDGRGVPQDHLQAMSWYLKAAEQGLARAQNNLGNLYNEGLGSPQNYRRAHMWYALSSANGDERAARNMELLEQVMSAEDIAAAKALLENWSATHARKIAQP